MADWRVVAANELTLDEQDLVRSVEAARAYWPKQNGDDSRVPVIIRAAVLRDILLGQKLLLRTDDGILQREIVLTPFGLRIQPPDNQRPEVLVEIEGKLDLQHIAVKSGETIAPLFLQYCQFDQPIEMTGASMASLSMFGSRFSELCLKDSDIRGPLDLSSCGPLPNMIFRSAEEGSKDQSDLWPFAGHIFRKGKDGEPVFVPLPENLPEPTATEPLSTEQVTVNGEAADAATQENDDQVQRCAEMIVPAPGLRLAECTVDLRNARIDGACTFRAASFVREFRPFWPADRIQWDKKRKNRFDCAAVDMTGVHVTGSVDFAFAVVVGGIRLANCVVEEDVWFAATRLLAFQQLHGDFDAQPALNLQHSRISGGLIFRAAGPSFLPANLFGDARRDWAVNVVIGDIIGLGLDVGMIWASETIAHSWGFPIALDGARIRNSCRVGPFGSAGTDGHVWIQGTVSMASVQVGGDFHFRNSGCPQVGANGPQPAQSVRIYDLLKLGSGFMDSLRSTATDAEKPNFCQLAFTGGQVGGDVVISSSTFHVSDRFNDPKSFALPSPSAAIDLWKTNAVRGLLIDEDTETTGALRLSRSQWGKHVKICPRAITAVQSQRRFATCIDAKALRIDGDFTLGGKRGTQLRGRVNLAEMQVAGNAHLCGLGFAHPKNMDLQGKNDSDDWMSLEATQVGGRLTVEALTWNLASSRADASDLEHDAFLQGPWRFGTIACYPDALIAEQQRPDAIVRAIFFPKGLAGSGPCHFVLDGTSAAIHGLNRASPSPLQLDSAEKRLAYLAFFCDNVHGDEGPFRIITCLDSARMEDLPAGEGPVRPHQFTDPEEKQTETEGGAIAWDHDVTVIYAAHVFGATMQVRQDGMVEMLEDWPIRALKEELPVDKGMLRAPLMPHWLKTVRYTRNLGVFGWRRARDARSLLLAKRAALATVTMSSQLPRKVNLSRLRCAFMDDEFGNGWGLTEGLRLAVVGFHCDHVEHTSEQNSARAIAPPVTENSSTKMPAIGEATTHFSEAIDQGATHKKNATTNRLQWLHMQFARQPVARWRARLAGMLLAMGGAVPLASGLLRQLAEPLVRHRPLITSKDFAPQSWDVFAMSDLRAGEREKGHAIIIDRTRQSAKIAAEQMRKALRTRWGLFWSAGIPLAVFGLWILAYPDQRDDWRAAALTLAVIGVSQAAPIILRIGDWLFRWGFSYGLSSARALRTIVLLLALGTAATHLARTGSVISGGGEWDSRIWISDPATGERILRPEIALVLAVDYDADAKVDGRPVTRGPVLSGNVVFADAAPCIYGVTSSLYALDVFVPVLDLDQESRCTIREQQEGSEGSDPYAWWRYAKSLFEILGWIVTSLTILTISGVMRRDMER
jgi:hypothetical protein